jgi:hypothetical protein
MKISVWNVEFSGKNPITRLQEIRLSPSSLQMLSRAPHPMEPEYLFPMFFLALKSISRIVIDPGLEYALIVPGDYFLVRMSPARQESLLFNSRDSSWILKMG